MSDTNSADLRQKIEAAFEAIEMCKYPGRVFEQLASYVELLVRWNSRISLTSIRDVDEMIRVHLVECAFAASQLPSKVATLLDYGSGAGLPGVLIAACCPSIHVTLAEAHTKKAAFLREAVRTLGLHAEIFNARVERMDQGRLFDCVTVRAVERMEAAIPLAGLHASKYLMLLTTEQSIPLFSSAGRGFSWREPIPVPATLQRVLLIGETSS